MIKGTAMVEIELFNRAIGHSDRTAFNSEQGKVSYSSLLRKS